MKQTKRFKATFFLLVSTLQILFLSGAGFGQSGGFILSPIVKRGTPSPDGGRFFDCDICEGRINGTHAFNNRGDVGLAADTEVLCGGLRFLYTTEKSVVLADHCQQTPWGLFYLFGEVNINAQSQAAFIAGPLIGDSIPTMIFSYSEGQTTKVVADGDSTPLGTIFRRCGLSEPSINNKREIAFGACSDDGQEKVRDGIFVSSNGQIHPIAVTEDPTDILPGKFHFNFVPAVRAIINNNSEVLFQGKIIPDSFERERYGWFLKTDAGIKKVFIDEDPLVDGLVIEPRTQGTSDLNDKGEVVFSVLTVGKSDSGIFVRSGDKTSKIMAQGDSTPIGGRFTTLYDDELIENNLLLSPRINANSSVAFKAKIQGGSSRKAIFLASTKAMVKVAAVGDTVPSGEVIREIDTFALNDNGEVAFFAYGTKNQELPLGVYKAIPVTPKIQSVKLKNKKGRLELRVNGNGFITNDTVIEINGVALDVMIYPEDAREEGGTSVQVISRDGRLEQLLLAGQTAHITVFNGLTNQRSSVKEFVR
jgi:hypothetical protein